MELTQKQIPAEIRYSAQQAFDVLAGKELTIESTPDGEEMLTGSKTVPAGKSWRVVISISVVETDV